jgi:hypothetical protein
MEFDMHRPDTMIEIHRERVQDQTLEMFSGDKYTESVDGTGYSATATLDLTLDRVWFIVDSLDRLWQEETDGDSHDPLRHFAIDLVIFNSKIVIDSVTCIPLVELPPATITIPDGPRGVRIPRTVHRGGNRRDGDRARDRTGSVPVNRRV